MRGVQFSISWVARLVRWESEEGSHMTIRSLIVGASAREASIGRRGTWGSQNIGQEIFRISHL